MRGGSTLEVYIFLSFKHGNGGSSAMRANIVLCDLSLFKNQSLDSVGPLNRSWHWFGLCGMNRRMKLIGCLMC